VAEFDLLRGIAHGASGVYDYRIIEAEMPGASATPSP
jgi:hypothetical protein